MLNSEDTNDLSHMDISRIIGYIPQEHSPSFLFSVLDVVLMACAHI